MHAACTCVIGMTSQLVLNCMHAFTLFPHLPPKLVPCRTTSGIARGGIAGSPWAHIAAWSLEARRHGREKRGKLGHFLRRHRSVFVFWLVARCGGRVERGCVSHTKSTAAFFSRGELCPVGIYVEHVLHLVASCWQDGRQDHQGVRRAVAEQQENHDFTPCLHHLPRGKHAEDGGGACAWC